MLSIHYRSPWEIAAQGPVPETLRQQEAGTNMQKMQKMEIVKFYIPDNQAFTIQKTCVLVRSEREHFNISIHYRSFNPVF